MSLSTGLGVEYVVFVSSCSLKMRKKYTNWDKLVCLSLYIFQHSAIYTKGSIL